MTQPTETSSTENRDFLRHAAQNSLLNFAQLLNPKFEALWYHELIAEKLEEALEKAANNGKARIILTIPPRHGKSQLASIYFPAWALGKHPDMPIILSSYGAELSEKIGMQTRDVISSEPYQAIFPNITLRPDQKAKAKWMTNKNGSFTAVGIGGAVTGTGGKIIILDDPHKDRAEAESALMRDNVWQYYNSTLYSRLEGHGAVIAIMQRWHTDDLIGRILEESNRLKEAGQPYDEWEIINFPAIADEDEFVNGTKVREKGEPLWPSKFPLDVLKTIEAKDVYNWSSQYQQDPILSANQDFQQSMFKYFEEQDIAGLTLQYTTTVDPAGYKKKSDDNVVLTIGKEVYGERWFIVDIIHGVMTPGQVIDAIFATQAKYKSDVYIEGTAYQSTLKWHVEERQRKTRQYFVVNETHPKGAKEGRIKSLLNLYNLGVLYHRKHYTALERQLLQFPRGKNDDLCFVAGTKIATIYGDKNIEDIKVGDKIISPFGMSEVTASRYTGTKKVINNIGLIGTLDHPIFTHNGGFRSLMDLQHNDILSILSIKDLLKWRYKKVLYSTESFTELWGREDIILANQKPIKEGSVPKDFMWRFGSFIKEKRYRKAGMFIMLTGTHSIIVLTILSVFQLLSTISNLKILINKKIVNICQKLGNSQKNGMHLQKEESGTKNIQKKYGLIQKSLSVFVLYAKNALNHSIQILTYVLTSVEGLKIRLRGLVLFVKQNLWSTEAIKPQKHVPSNVQEVYGLSTKSGVYYANGILVSNCDALAAQFLAASHGGGSAVQTRPKNVVSYLRRR